MFVPVKVLLLVSEDRKQVKRKIREIERKAKHRRRTNDCNVR